MEKSIKRLEIKSKNDDHYWIWNDRHCY